MKHVLEYVGTLVHLLGMLLFVGGHIWFGLCTARAEQQQQRDGERFLTATLPVFVSGFGIGILLLFVSGLLKLLVWGEPGLIFLPDLYGWILFGKLLLYIIIVGNGILIERRYVPYALAKRTDDPLSPSAAWAQIKLRARLNLLLILVVVALGQTLRFSRL